MYDVDFAQWAFPYIHVFFSAVCSWRLCNAWSPSTSNAQKAKQTSISPYRFVLPARTTHNHSVGKPHTDHHRQYLTLHAWHVNPHICFYTVSMYGDGIKKKTLHMRSVDTSWTPDQSAEKVKELLGWLVRMWFSRLRLHTHTHRDTRGIVIHLLSLKILYSR